MASYKLNTGRVRGCPGANELVRRMEAFGMPETEEFGVLNCSGTTSSAFATIVRTTSATIKQVDPETKEVCSKAIDKAMVIPVAITPGADRLEVYAGSKSAIEQAGIFLSSCLALKTVTETIEFDVAAAVEKLAKETNKFQLRTIKISDYAANAYMIGGYGPKFMDTDHGLEFMREYAAGLQSVQVRFQGPTGKVTLTLRPDACISYSCNEDDQTAVQAIIRKLVM